ncbi:MAG: beta-lactamase family protein [Bacteroidales bacterium]|jgi:CubicO group peptidase (beta-lactamase class C family)|nr:beta-lactamase family protein [Bacteroidales bacterium]
MNRIILSATLLLASSFIASFAPVAAQNIASSEHIQSVLQPYIDNSELSGAVVVVADRSKTLSITSVGWQDIAQKKKMAPDALFWIASQSKPITATAVMMLVEEGKINLDEPVTTYLPELQRLKVSVIKRDTWQAEEAVNKPVTVRHLLSHTSGMSFLAGIQEQKSRIDVLPLSLSLYATTLTPLIAQPGTSYNYSNQGINIAATVVERITGMPFSQFLQERLFDPLGMKNTTFFPTEQQIKKYVVPYCKNAKGHLEAVEIEQLQYPLTDRVKRHAEYAGGLFSTPEDLVKFYRMIANHGALDGKRYLTEQSVALMGSPCNIVPNTGYGLGWAVSDKTMGHGGAYGTESKVRKDSGVSVLYFNLGKDLPKQEEAKKNCLDKIAELYNLEK